MSQSYQNQINEKVARLPVYHQLAFGILMTERFLSNYFAFYLIEKWGNPIVLMNTIDFLKNIIREQSYNEEELNQLDEAIENITPDMDDFPGNILASLALDVSDMFYECFAFAEKQQSRHIQNCSKIGFDSLEMYIQKKKNLSNTLSSEQINAYLTEDELIKKEITAQNQILDELAQTEDIKTKLYVQKDMEMPQIEFHELLSQVG